MFEYPSLYFDDPPQAGRAVDLWFPKQPSKTVCLYFVHGGGWAAGHREQMHRLMHAFYRLGYPCASVCYRLNGAKIPEQLSDVREGMARVRERLIAAGLPPRLAVYGSSAGGHLALLAGLAPEGACGESFTEREPGSAPDVAAVVASCAPTTFEPWEDIFPGIWSSMQKAAGTPYEEDPALYRKFSPAAYADRHSPPLLFLMGECEHMFPNRQTIAFAEKLRAQGHSNRYGVYTLAEHGFFYDVTRNAQRAAFREMLAFLESLETS